MTQPIQHVVVVMLENRSYDNVLGWLYNSSNNAPYNQAPPGQSDLQGLTGSESNPDPLNPGTTITISNPISQTVGGSGQEYPGTAVPLIDPGELFGDMAQQFLGTATYPAGTAAQMQGFTANYLNALLKSTAASVSNLAQNNLQDVMTYLTPQQLPVTAFLAKNFAVCDEWFASVPSQTYVNRVFALCAAPAIVQAVPASDGLPAINYSVVDDLDFPVNLASLRPSPTLLPMPTVCDQLDLVLGDAAVNWKIYFHDYSIAVMTMPSIAAAATSAKNQNVSTFDNLDWGSGIPKQLATVPTTFVDDVTNTNGGVLPAFSFIEPRYSSTYATNQYPPNSNHPGPSEFGIGKNVDPSDPPIDATGGELLLMQVYNLLQNSTYWDSTLLIITYDEPGGIYDHCFPPPATPPAMLNATTPRLAVPPASPSLISVIENSRDTAALGFDYSLFGGRVPAILVSPYLAAGSTVRADGAVFDHSSIVKTVWEVFGLSQAGSNVTSLSERDAAAPSVTSLLTSDPGNTTVAFSNAIVASPSSIVLQCTHLESASTTMLVSGGFGVTLDKPAIDAPLPKTSKPWLHATMSPGTAGTDVMLVTVTTKIHLDTPKGTYPGTITFKAKGKKLSTTVNATLYVS